MSLQKNLVMPQRQSECFRTGKTAEEFRVVKALAEWGATPLTDMAFCFECSREFQLSDPTQFPQICRNQNCRKKYHDFGMFCLPDVILHEGGINAIVMVNGPIHNTSKKQRIRDKYQITRFKQLRWTVFIITNDEVGRESNLLSMTRTWVDAMKDPALMYKIMRNEHEY
jgi:hypothetical protein